MSSNNARQYLKLLSILHYFYGGLIGFLSLLFLFHFFVGLDIINSPEFFSTEPSGEVMSKEWGYLFAIFGAIFVIIGQIIAIITISSGRFLRRHKNYSYSFILAFFMCPFVPFGTALGVFTIIVLSRESVKELYGLSSNKQ